MTSLTCIELKTGKPCGIPDATVVALGNFDGVHIAHRALIGRAMTVRNETAPNASCCVFCFKALPDDILSPNPPPHLSTLEERMEAFRECGVEYVIQAEFEVLKDLSPEAFAQLLVSQCHTVAAVCGFNYRFGKNGAGDAERLKRLLPCPVSVEEAYCVDGLPVSSTRIRNLLAEGRAEEAARLLTRPYAIISPVKHGKQLGRTLGFPTANQSFPPHALVPKYGVYQTECEVDGKTYRGLTNVGIRPTVAVQATENCETYLPDFSGDLYGKDLRVSFLRYLRQEQTFPSVEALRRQIERDLQQLK